MADRTVDAARPASVLIPGDSPVGLRLPLTSLPWVAGVGSAAIFPGRSDGQLSPLPEPPAYLAR